MEQNPLPESLETRLIRCISPLIPVPSNLPMAHKAVILRQSSTDQELKAKREKKKKQQNHFNSIQPHINQKMKAGEKIQHKFPLILDTEEANSKSSHLWSRASRDQKVLHARKKPLMFHIMPSHLPTIYATQSLSHERAALVQQIMVW